MWQITSVKHCKATCRVIKMEAMQSYDLYVPLWATVFKWAEGSFVKLAYKHSLAFSCYASPLFLPTDFHTRLQLTDCLEQFS